MKHLRKFEEIEYRDMLAAQTKAARNHATVKNATKRISLIKAAVNAAVKAEQAKYNSEQAFGGKRTRRGRRTSRQTRRR